MFILKIIGSLIVIVSCSLLGYTYASTYSERLNSLIGIQNCLQILETEVMYSATPIPVALENVYKKGSKKVSFIFKDIGEQLRNGNTLGLGESFFLVSNTLMDQLKLDAEDVEIFESFGRVLGTSNREDQQKHFKVVLSQLKAQQKDAEKKKETNEKMYKSLGILAGFAIVFILI